MENQGSRHVPHTDDVDMAELGDLFMRLSGAEPSEPWRIEGRPCISGSASRAVPGRVAELPRSVLLGQE